MLFEKGDQILFDGHKRHCIIADEVQAIFALLIPYYYEEDEEVVLDGQSVYYGELIALSNDNDNEIEYTRLE